MPRAAPRAAPGAAPGAAPSVRSAAPSSARQNVVRAPPHRRRRRVRKRHTQRARVHVNHGVVSEAVLAVLLGCARLLTPREQAAECVRVVARWRRALRVEPQVAQARVPT